MELDFDKYCKLSGSPNTVLPSPRRRSKPEKSRSTNRDPTYENNLFTLQEDFSENNFLQFRSISCKNTSKFERNEGSSRGSVYQRSQEISKMKSNEYFEGRKKIELSEKDSTFFSFGIVDSLCSSDEDSSFSNKRSFPNKNDSSLERAKFDFSHSRETYIGLHKSLSAKIEKPQLHFQSESDSSRLRSPRFGPIRKIFDPFTKSKSQRSPLGPSSDSKIKQDNFRKSLLSDFSKTQNIPESFSSGFLKLETKHGTPFFEFSLNFAKDVLVARRWKSGKGLNWVYTFHYFLNNRKSNATTQWESKDLKKSSSMVGQMQVSCYLHTNINTEGSLDNSMMTEFVTYGITEPNNIDPTAQKSSEIAAIVVEMPYEKRESLKHKGGDETSLFDLCEISKRKGVNKEMRVDVVVPSGTHGSPNADVVSCGPSSLLDRWRSNGVCDCGGWDIGCPLNVFESLDNGLVWKNQWPFELFVKGVKEISPAFIITEKEEGSYRVDFQEKLSTLQAFSMCVAIFHCTEASPNTTREREKHISKSDSLQVPVEREIADLTEAVVEDKKTEIKNIGEKLPNFKMKPPFSPMARV